MQRLFVIILLLAAVNLFGINFHPITEGEVVAILNMESIESNGFEIVEITTHRERNGVERNETWKGIRFLDMIRLWTHLRNWDYEFVSTDGYLVRLNIQELALFMPIIAIERDSVPLPDGRWSLVSQNMPEMYWISNITDIYERGEVVFTEPVRIWTHHNLLAQMRLYTNPEPFVDVQGYRFDDLFFTNDLADSINASVRDDVSDSINASIRLVSKDGIEQILPYPEYLKNAYLQITDSESTNQLSYSIICPDMPTGMWLKDLMLIQTDGNIIFFHNDVDRAENAKYREFVDYIKQYEWLESTAYGFQPVTDWEKIDWSEIDYLLRQ